MATRVRASHLLVKHKDVRRPSSWKVRTFERWQGLVFGGDRHGCW